MPAAPGNGVTAGVSVGGRGVEVGGRDVGMGGTGEVSAGCVVADGWALQAVVSRTNRMTTSQSDFQEMLGVKGCILSPCRKIVNGLYYIGKDGKSRIYIRDSKSNKFD